MMMMMNKTIIILITIIDQTMMIIMIISHLRGEWKASLYWEPSGLVVSLYLF